MSYAYIFGQPGADPVRDRMVMRGPEQHLTVVPVPDEALAPGIAEDLIGEGIQLIELCGGFTAMDAARVVEAVDGRVPVGHVAFSNESVTGAAAYRERFASQDGAA